MQSQRNFCARYFFGCLFSGTGLLIGGGCEGSLSHTSQDGSKADVSVVDSARTDASALDANAADTSAGDARPDVTLGEDAASDASSNVCGNGLVESGESCDGNDYQGASCQSRGFSGGSLMCNGCQIDQSGCTNNTGPSISCSEQPPQPHRAYTDGQEACFLSDLNNGAGARIYVGLTNGVAYLYQSQAAANGWGGPSCVNDRCIAHNSYAGCLRAAGWDDDIDYFADPPSGAASHPLNGWRPSWLDTNIEMRTYQHGSLICTNPVNGGRPIRAYFEDNIWKVKVQELDHPSMRLCRIDPDLAKGNINGCVEPGGGTMPRFVLERCFPDFNQYACE